MTFSKHSAALHSVVKGRLYFIGVPTFAGRKWVGTVADSQVKYANSNRGIGITFPCVTYFILAQIHI